MVVKASIPNVNIHFVHRQQYILPAYVPACLTITPSDRLPTTNL